MKRRFTSVFALLLLLVCAPFVMAAQDSRAVWDLTETLKLTDLGLNVKYPTGWVYEAGKSGGVYLAETQDDLTAVNDDDPATLATGTTIQLIATKQENLKEQLGGEDATLDALADLLVQSRGITEKGDRADVPVITRRARVASGEDSGQQGLILALWKQSGYYMAAIVTSPSYDEVNRVGYSFGQMLGSMSPTDTLPLGEKNIANFGATKAQITYPEGWGFSSDKPGYIYELESDAKNGTSEGLTLRLTEIGLAAANLDEKATVVDLTDMVIKNTGLEEPVIREEFILLGQPALTIRGKINSGEYVITTQAIVDGNVIQIAVVGMDEEKVNAFEPTFVSILQTLRPAQS